MNIFGYRGYSGKYPENTKLAFQKAIEAGADGIQLDIHFTRDRQIVIIHDESLSRITNGVGFVRHHSLNDLKNYEIKGNYEGERQGIITLEEYLQWAEHLPVLSSISLKNGRFYYPGLEEESIALIRKYNVQDKVLLTSPRKSSLEHIRNIWPQAVIGWEIDRFDDEILEKAQDLNVDFIIPDLQVLNEQIIEAVAACDIKVMPYSVDSLDDLERMQTYKVAGLYTMFIGKARQVMGITDHPYSEEDIEKAKEGLYEDEKEPETTSEHIKKRSEKLSDGVLGILVGMIISVIGSVLAAQVVMGFLSSLFF